MTAIIVFCLLSALLVAGKVLRTLIPLLQRCYLPSSVIGGFIGLAIFQGWPELVPAEVVSTILPSSRRARAGGVSTVGPNFFRW